jgi:hypothetical protein
MACHSHHSIDTLSIAIDLNNASTNHLSNPPMPPFKYLPQPKQSCEPDLSLQRVSSLSEPVPITPPDRLPLPATRQYRLTKPPVSADRLDHHSAPDRDHPRQLHAHGHSPLSVTY